MFYHDDELSENVCVYIIIYVYDSCVFVLTYACEQMVLVCVCVVFAHSSAASLPARRGSLTLHGLPRILNPRAPSSRPSSLNSQRLMRLSQNGISTVEPSDTP